jgi:WD40 repeat protein
MSSNASFDRDLRAWLDEKAGQQQPDYLGEALARTSAVSQRKRWSSLQWWLPTESTRNLLATPLPVTVRLLIVGLLILALVGVIAAGALLRRPAPPFGPAGNGLLALANPEVILIADADGTNQRVLVDVKDGVESLTWSPDGTKLAFRTLGPATREPTVMVVNRDGSGLIDVTPGMSLGGYDEAISWSPDSTRLAIPSPGETGGRLIVANADGSNARALEVADGPANVHAAAWSPDGEWIAFVGSTLEATKTGLYLVRPDGSQAHLIGAVAPDSHGGPPQWAPDPSVSRLVFADAKGGIVMYDAATGQDERLSRAGDWPSWSPDASQVAWWSNGILVGEVSGLLAGASPRLLVSVFESCRSIGRPVKSTPCGPPVWSPDGTRIFAVDLSAKAVVALSVDGSQPPITIVLPPGTELNPIGSAAWQRVARFPW